MFSDALPHLDEVKQYYEIAFDSYSVAMFHPVTTEADTLLSKANDFVDALIESKKDCVVIYPNNDLGSKHILKKLTRSLKVIHDLEYFPPLDLNIF